MTPTQHGPAVGTSEPPSTAAPPRTACGPPHRRDQDFGPVHAVAGSTWFAPGEVVAFLGPNGAGKTTTIDMVLGLAQPHDGRVEVLGLDPRRRSLAAWWPR